MHLLAQDKVLSGSSLAGPGMGEWTQYSWSRWFYRSSWTAPWPISGAKGQFGGDLVTPISSITSPSPPHIKPTQISMLSMLNHVAGTSLVAQWQRIHLPVQETPVQLPIQEDPTCCRPAKPVRHNS